MLLMLMQDVLLHKLSYQRLPVLVGVWLNRSNWVEGLLWNSLGRIQEKMLRLLLIEPLTVSFSGKIIFLCQKNHNHLGDLPPWEFNLIKGEYGIRL